MMMTAERAGGDWVDGLRTQLRDISLSLQAMMVLLVREREALVGRSDAKSLEDIARDKQSAVTQVGALYERLRDAVSRHIGPETSLGDGMTALRAHSESVAGQVDELVQLTRSCQQANQDNGALVNAGLDHAQQAMMALTQTGVEATSKNIYGRAAKQHTGNAGSQFTVRA